MCPHPTPVATKSHLVVLSLPVAIITSCWSSVYPCSYHNTLLVLSGSLWSKSPQLWSSAYLCSKQSSQVVLGLPL